MGYLTLETANEDLSWVIGKNPSSGMIGRSLRMGTLWGWYHNSTTYVMRFLDHTDDVSFKSNKNDIHNYIANLQYCSPLLLSAIVVELFNSTLNKPNQRDVSSKSILTSHLIKLNPRALRFISKLNTHIPQFQISTNSTPYPNLYKISIKCESTIKNLLNYSYLLGILLNVIVVGYIDKPSIEQLEKIVNFANDIGIPYYPRYLIKTNMMHHDDFAKLKNKLELLSNISDTNNKVDMFWGNSHSQRYDFIESHTSLSTDIIDFGCGEGFYVKKLLPQLSKLSKYVAWDANIEELQKVKYFKEKNPEYTNLIIANTQSELFEITKDLVNPTLLITEVFEHVERDKIVELMEELKTNINFGSAIITTPDVGFNVHYSLDMETDEGIKVRHLDHKYEYTREEFENIINMVFSNGCMKKFYQVGDRIGPNSITQSFIITREKREEKEEPEQNN